MEVKILEGKEVYFLNGALADHQNKTFFRAHVMIIHCEIRNMNLTWNEKKNIY